MKCHAPDALWLAALRASADQAPARPRVPLLWREHLIGSVEPDYFWHSELQRSTDLGALLRQEAPPGGPVWRLLGEATGALAQIAQALRSAQVGRVLQHWRSEQLAVCNAQGEQLATVERGIARPLGIATRAVHLVGHASNDRVWVQRRALDKANDPGLWDTLMGGMVSAADTVDSALARETWEEAGLRLDSLSDLRRGGQLAMRKPSSDEADAGYVVEKIDWYRCTVPDGVQPLNQDGEVARFALLDRSELLARLERNEFTTEAALILVDALRDAP